MGGKEFGEILVTEKLVFGDFLVCFFRSSFACLILVFERSSRLAFRFTPRIGLAISLIFRRFHHRALGRLVLSELHFHIKIFQGKILVLVHAFIMGKRIFGILPFSLQRINQIDDLFIKIIQLEIKILFG